MYSAIEGVKYEYIEGYWRLPDSLFARCSGVKGDGASELMVILPSMDLICSIDASPVFLFFAFFRIASSLVLVDLYRRGFFASGLFDFLGLLFILKYTAIWNCIECYMYEKNYSFL